ncbi:MAG: cytochrome oxidase subunit III [Bacteroidota bacterium]|nr:cytochrome oxidase subunit III [Bacteroidota bacterium]
MSTTPTSKILRMNPRIFMVWIFMISISMIFVSLISAYIVKKGEPGGFNVDLPSMFYYSTAVVLLSSIFKQLSYFASKKDNFKNLKLYLFLSLLTGILFLITQYLGWVQLVGGGVYFVGHPDGSFIYILSGVHAFHLISGLFFILYVYRKSVKLDVHSKNMIFVEMSTTYWHFLAGLWVYLFITLYFYNI